MTAPAPAASPIVVCMCGHVARMHREDDDELCKVDGCDCTGFHRLRGPVAAVTGPRPAPAPARPASPPAPAAPPPSPVTAAPKPAPAGPPHPPAGAGPREYACDQCDRTFPSPSQRNGHRGQHVLKANRQQQAATAPPAAATAKPAEPAPAPPPKPTPAPAPSAAVGPSAKGDLSRHDIVLRVDLGKYGTVKIEGLQLGTPEFAALLRAVEKLMDETMDLGSAT